MNTQTQEAAKAIFVPMDVNLELPLKTGWYFCIDPNSSYTQPETIAKFNSYNKKWSLESGDGIDPTHWLKRQATQPVPVERTAEEVEALAILAVVMDRTYGCRDDAVISDVRTKLKKAIDLLNAAASTVPKTAGVWVKASERLPNNGGYYFVKAGPDKALWSRKRLSAIAERLNREKAECFIEWLDESSPTSGEGNK